MKIHYLQHAPFEDLGSIADWIQSKGHALTCTRLYQGEILPNPAEFDWLIIMGGPMNVYETDRYPWLTGEKTWIRSAIDNRLMVMGICLGAQLIASALGARVIKNPQQEIGWFPITRSDELANSPLARILPEEIEVFHWHGDTFELPAGAIRIAASKACRNQGFVYRGRVIGLQFHLETTTTGIEQLIEHCGSEITTAPYIQTPEVMLSSDPGRFQGINDLLYKLLDYQESLILKNTNSHHD